MFAVGNLIAAVASIVNWVLTALYWLILVRALVSWVNPDPFNLIVQFLHASTEWMLQPLRRIMPFRFRMAFDISPIIAFLLIIFLKEFLVRTLFDLALRVKLTS